MISYSQARLNLISAVRLARDALIGAGYADELKTVDYYQRVLWRDVRDLYNGEMDEGAFVDDMVRLIDEQLRRAWNEGMRDNDLDPAKDMTPEWEAILQDIQLNELDYVDDFAQEIIKAQQNGAPVEQFQSRVSIWVNRYNEVVNESRITTRPEDKFEWVFGDTEHCSTCAALNGVVATGKQWEESGYKPQNPPNDALECGGWHCQCHLDYTEKPLTEGGIPDV